MLAHPCKLLESEQSPFDDPPDHAKAKLTPQHRLHHQQGGIIHLTCSEHISLCFIFSTLNQKQATLRDYPWGAPPPTGSI